jgi:hypothetical protein
MAIARVQRWRLLPAVGIQNWYVVKLAETLPMLSVCGRW